VTKEVISQLNQSMAMEREVFLILSGIIAEFTDVHVKRCLQRSIYDLAQFVEDSQHTVLPAPSKHPLKMMLYNREMIYLPT